MVNGACEEVVEWDDGGPDTILVEGPLDDDDDGCSGTLSLGRVLVIIEVAILPPDDSGLCGDLDINKGLVLGDVNLTDEGALTVGVVIVGLYGLELGGVVSVDDESLWILEVGVAIGEGVLLLILPDASSRDYKYNK